MKIYFVYIEENIDELQFKNYFLKPLCIALLLSGQTLLDNIVHCFLLPQLNYYLQKSKSPVYLEF